MLNHTVTKSIALSVLFVFAFAIHSAIGAGAISPEKLAELQAKEKIVIAVTDSGLGGLTVVADAVKKLQNQKVFKKVDLIFYNALFTNQGGYNSLRTRSEKVNVFSSALQSLEERFSPDLILIACNTLSVIYDDTRFAQKTTTPVMGIVKNGVDQIAEQLNANKSSQNILFATQTTVDEASHLKALISRGIDADRLLPQACPELTLYIEKGFDSMETEMLIDAYVDEALTKLGEIKDPLFISLNCTHFGYALEAWREAFSSRGITIAGILNPNDIMIDFLLPQNLWHRHPQTEVTVQVVSQTEIPKDRQESIGRYLEGVSPATAKALRDYRHQPNLFPWRHLINRSPQ